MNKLCCALFCAFLVVAQAAAQEKIQPAVLIVMGSAEARAVPDNATVRLGVMIQADTAAAAHDQANQVMTKLLQKLQALKISKKDVQTSGLSLTPIYGQPRPNEQPPIVAFAARNVISVITTDLNLIGRIIDAATSAGANTVEGVFFGLRDDKEARSSSLRDAVLAARQKAEVMATAMGVELAGVQEIIEGGVMQIPQPMYDARMLAGPSSTPVEPGQISVSASVTIKYLIRAK